MKVLDSQGRLFGKISILDVGAALVILLVVVGIFFFPGTGGSTPQIAGATTKPIEVDLIVRGLSVRNPQVLIDEFNSSKRTSLIIRNQSAGEVDVKSVKLLDRKLAVPQPDGSVKPVADPRAEESYSAYMLMTLGGKAEITPTGVVIGGTKIKIGSTVELEGFTYNFNASVIGLRSDGKDIAAPAKSEKKAL